MELFGALTFFFMSSSCTIILTGNAWRVVGKKEVRVNVIMYTLELSIIVFDVSWILLKL